MGMFLKLFVHLEKFHYAGYKKIPLNEKEKKSTIHENFFGGTNMSKDDTIVIRNGRMEDAEAVLEIHKSVSAEKNYLITLPEEYHKTVSEQKEWIQKKNRE